MFSLVNGLIFNISSMLSLDTKSSLILHSSGEDKPIFGTVICVGDGTNEEGKQMKMQVKKDDKVIFSKYCGVSIRLNSEEVFVLRQK